MNPEPSTDQSDEGEIAEDSRRTFERKVHRNQCRVIVDREDGRYEYTAWTQDVSATGVRFRVLAPELPKTGAMIQLPGMVGKATTMKIVRASDLGNDHFEYGARFTGIQQIAD